MLPSRFSRFGAIAATLTALAIIPVARTANINVTVGGPGILKFNPDFTDANVGDTITFIFMQKNHTVTQSSLEDPCQPLAGGFDSGFVPVADSVTNDFPIATLPITDTNPIWIFCRQANHCQQGMVFAVNPGDKFAQFQSAAVANGSTATSAATTTAAASGSAPSVVTVTATVTVSGSAAATTTYGSYPGSSAPTSATSTDHKVTVGDSSGSLVYNPSNITAQPGDTVTFEFHQKNHTVTQSSFNQPCVALASSSSGAQVGFDSGFMFVAAGATTFPTFTIQINDTTPIWAYCRQNGHCGQEMVFSVNAVESGPNTFEAFQAKAKQLNGTSTSSSSAAGASASNGALARRTIGGAGTAVVAVGVLFGCLL